MFWFFELILRGDPDLIVQVIARKAAKANDSGNDSAPVVKLRQPMRALAAITARRQAPNPAAIVTGKLLACSVPLYHWIKRSITSEKEQRVWPWCFLNYLFVWKDNTNKSVSWLPAPTA